MAGSACARASPTCAARAVLLRLLSMQALAFVFFTLVLPIEIVYAKETLDAGDSGYGALLSSWGAGMVVGSLVFVAAARRVSLQTQLFVSTAMIGGAYLGMAAAGTLRRGVRGRGRRRHRQRRPVGRADERRPGADRRAGTRRGSWACWSRSGA